MSQQGTETKVQKVPSNKSNKVILFRKNSQFQSEDKESNNSMIIYDKDNRTLKFNVVDKQFFDKKKIVGNIKQIRKEIDIKVENGGTKLENQNLNNTVEESEKAGPRISESDLKKSSKNEEECNIIISSKRLVLNKPAKESVSENNDKEMLLLRANNIKEKKIDDQLSSGVKLKQSADHKSEHSSFEFPYKVCLICDVYFNSNSVQVFKCDHILCNSCMKLFYEEKIEEGKKELKCPVFKCKELIDPEIVKKFVTEKHFNNFLKKLEINDEKIAVFPANEEKGTFHLAKKSTTFMDNNDFKNYSKKHVLEVTASISFLYYSKTKEVYCKNCNEESLFGKNCRNFIKCMNCLKTYCKYCSKNYSVGHFDFTGNNYCKIFFRRHCRYLPSERNRCREAVSDFIVFLMGYIVFVVGVINYINLLVRSILNNEKQENVKSSFQILIVVLISCVVLPILFLMLPFYPAMVAIFR